ncbi:MAG: 50S ribosomal protein L24 [Candidatus Micrarchaeota archaeon]
MPSSVQPRKQRKARADAALHQRKMMMHANVSKTLRAKLGTSRRSAIVRKGDKVRITTGSFKKKEGVVLEADYSCLKLYIEGIVRKNARGQEKLVPIDPSNVQISDGDFTLKDRKAMLERSAKPKAQPSAGSAQKNK